MSEIGERKKKYIDSLSSCTLCVLLQTYVCLVNLLFVFNVKWVTWRLNVFVLLCCDERSRQLGLKSNSYALVLMMLRHILSVWYYFKFNPKLYVLSGLWLVALLTNSISFKWEREKVTRCGYETKFMIFYWICFGALAAPTTWRLHHFVFSLLLSQKNIIFINSKTSSTGDLEMRFRM